MYVMNVYMHVHMYIYIYVLFVIDFVSCDLLMLKPGFVVFVLKCVMILWVTVSSSNNAMENRHVHREDSYKEAMFHTYVDYQRIVSHYKPIE